MAWYTDDNGDEFWVDEGEYDYNYGDSYDNSVNGVDLSSADEDVTDDSANYLPDDSSVVDSIDLSSANEDVFAGNSNYKPVVLPDGKLIYQTPGGGYVNSAGKSVKSDGTVIENNATTNVLNKLLGTNLTDKDVAALGLGAGGLMGLLGATNKQTTPVGYQGSVDMSRRAVREQVPQPTTPRTYGAPAMGQKYFTDVQYTNPAGLAAAQAAAQQQAQQIAAQQPAQQPAITAAGGGLMSAASGRYLQGSTDGMADDIRTSIDGKQPAALSHGEFVIPADVVSHLGNGNSDAGAKKLYDMMGRVRKARTGSTKQGRQINPNKFMPGGLANVKGYADGGGVSSGTGAAISAGLTGTESNLSNWAGPYVTDMLSQGQALANAPYQAYTGQMTAGTSPLQQQAFDQASNLTVPAGINTAATTAGDIASKAQGLTYTPTTSDFGTTQAAQYMNPFLQTALAPQLAELQRQNQIANMGINSQLTKAGGFGGGRQAVYNAENARNMMQQMDKTLGQGYMNAYQQAAQQFNTDQTRRAQEAQFGANYGLQGLNTALQGAQTQGQLGATANQAALANLGALSGAGATQRGIEQEALTAAQNEFNTQREHPYKMTQFQQSLLSGLPLAAQNYNMASASPLQNLLGGASGLADLLKVLGYDVPGK